MKLFVVGIGQAGGRIADELYAMGKYAKSRLNRHLEIITDAVVINTATVDLSLVKHIPKDTEFHRRQIGEQETHGHGVGQDAELGARLMKPVARGIVETIISSQAFTKADAILVIASAGGGTGAGGIGIFVQELKKRLGDLKPVYALLVLPFEWEEGWDRVRSGGLPEKIPFTIPNAARCYNTVNRYADATIVVDNSSFGTSEGSSVLQNFNTINRHIAESFYDLLSGGEEQKEEHLIGKGAGIKPIEFGEIRAGLKSLSVIGWARGELPFKKSPFGKDGWWWDKSKAGTIIYELLDKAMLKLSLRINPKDARRVICLISAPPDAVSDQIMHQVRERLEKQLSKTENIWYGDYPRQLKTITVTLLMSAIVASERIETLYKRAEEVMKIRADIKAETEKNLKEKWHSEDIPDLTQV